MPTTIEKTIRMNQLYDFYGLLLTEKQKTYFLHYFQDDYSLSEIAELLGVSRNAVFDQIQTAVEHLENYETHLRLFEKHQTRMTILQTMKTIQDPRLSALIEELERLE